MVRALYLDTSALLRATLESGTTPDIERKIQNAEELITSRLSRVEGARALLRLRQRTDFPEARATHVERELEAILNRCELWELTTDVCALASIVLPARNLRALDALHLATFLLARRRVEDLELLTADTRLKDAVAVV